MCVVFYSQGIQPLLPTAIVVMVVFVEPIYYGHDLWAREFSLPQSIRDNPSVNQLYTAATAAATATTGSGRNCCRHLPRRLFGFVWVCVLILALLFVSLVLERQKERGNDFVRDCVLLSAFFRSLLPQFEFHGSGLGPEFFGHGTKCIDVDVYVCATSIGRRQEQFFVVSVDDAASFCVAVGGFVVVVVDNIVAYLFSVVVRL